MPDDPKPKARIGTDPSGVRIPVSPRAITERGGGAGPSNHDRRKPKLTPAYIREQLNRRIDNLTEDDFESDQFTPVTTIAIVRSELKDDISAARKDIATLRLEITQLMGAVRANNELLPRLVDQLMGMISRSLDVEHHRQKTDVNDLSIGRRTRWWALGKVVSFVASGAGATLIINALMSGRC